jgi:hypothetical protein
VCKAHALAYERAIETDASPLPPQQPSREKKGVGRGGKPSPAAMGVTIIDLVFMHAIAMEGEKDKAARQEIKAKPTLLKRERDDLRDELEKERGDKLRLMKETDRGTLEQQIVEWTARAKTAEEKCKTISKASEEAIGKAREGDKAARQEIKAKMALLRHEKDNLIDELEKERVHKLRLVKETERGTLECQVVEWTARAKTAEEKCKTISKASEEAIGKAREGERKARQDKNSFVIDLQKKMEIGGIQMYCIERGSEGMFLPKTELHTQLEAWEREMERAWEEVGNVKAELMRVAAELRQTKKSHESLEGHAQALEEACRRVSREGKKAGTDRDRLEKVIETQKGRQEKRLQKEREQLELEKSKAESCQAQASKTNEIERQRRKKSESKVKKLDKFRLRASRYVDLRKKLHNKDYSQVS